MSFLYQAGLYALIGIPIIIIIYIIKNRFTEMVVSSTYIWTLSERFLKRRNPLRRMTGLLTLIIQLLMVVMIAFAAAQPQFTLVGSARDYLFIIDGSGTMNITLEDGTTRLDTAKSEVNSIINSASSGSTYTVMYVGDSITWVVEDSTDKSNATRKVSAIEGGYTTANFTNAYNLAQTELDNNSAVQIYLVTDKQFESEFSNLQVINVGSDAENYAVSNVSNTVYTTLDENGNEVSKIKVSADVWSYTSSATLNVALYLDGSDTPDYTETVDVDALSSSTVTLYGSTSQFEYYTVVVEANDSLLTDNSCIVYSKTQGDAYKTLLTYEYVTGTDAEGNSTLTSNRIFIEAILKTFGNSSIDIITSSEYSETISGYGLYIFDSYSPETSPTDGAVWFINPRGNTKKASFTVQSDVSLTNGGTLAQSTSTSSKIAELLSGTVNNSGYAISIKSYVKCTTNKTFYSLYYYGSDPVIFAGTNDYGNREVIFAFDFHESDFVITANYVPLMYNLFEYTFPEIIDETSYYCGDTVEINVLSGTEGISVVAPSGDTSYLSTDAESVEFTLSEVGTYTINLTISGSTRTVYIYSSLALEERYTSKTVTTDGLVTSNGETVYNASGEEVTMTTFTLYGTLSTDYRDGVFNEVWIWIAALAILYVADWGIYCYEQYQLR